MSYAPLLGICCNFLKIAYSLYCELGGFSFSTLMLTREFELTLVISLEQHSFSLGIALPLNGFSLGMTAIYLIPSEKAV